MDELQEFLDIVTQVRSHLEYLKALGVRTIECPSRRDFSEAGPAAAAPVPAPPPVKSDSGRRATILKNDLAGVRSELVDCMRCKLHANRTAIVFGEGNPKAEVVFVGEGPGPEEEKGGSPFAGDAGRLLTDIIVKGMKLRRDDVYFCTVVKCLLPDNRRPEADEISACEPFLLKQIEAISPKMIVALGDVAAQVLLNTTEGIGSLRGSWKTYHGIALMPTLHPARLLEHPKDKALVWSDIQLVMAKMGIKKQ